MGISGQTIWRQAGNFLLSKKLSEKLRTINRASLWKGGSRTFFDCFKFKVKNSIRGKNHAKNSSGDIVPLCSLLVSV